MLNKIVRILGRFGTAMKAPNPKTTSIPKPTTTAINSGNPVPYSYATTGEKAVNPKLNETWGKEEKGKAIKQEELVDEKTFLKFDLELAHTNKLRRVTDPGNPLEGKLKQIVGNAKLKVIKQLESSIAMFQQNELTEKLLSLDSEFETASNISCVGKLPHEKCEQELLESDNQEHRCKAESMITEEKSNNAESQQGEINKYDQTSQLFGALNEKDQFYNCSVEREKILQDNKSQVQMSLVATECQLNEAKKQCRLLEGKKMELPKHLKEISIKDDQMMNEIRKKYKLQKIQVTNAKKENVARIDQNKEHSESTLQAYLKEEMQLIKSQTENELRTMLPFLRKEHELQIKSIRMKLEEECQRMQEELEAQKSMAYIKEEMQRIKSQTENELRTMLPFLRKEHELQINSLRMKVEEECQRMQEELEVQKTKVDKFKTFFFPYHQHRMISTCSVNEMAPGNTATIILDKFNLSASQRSYSRAICKVIKYCKANSKVIDLSAFFGPGAEIFTTPAEGTFHLKFICRGRELTLFINLRDLYLIGWHGKQHGAFELCSKKEKWKRCIPVPGCRVIKTGFNYYEISKHHLGDIRIGPFAMMDGFEELIKCDGTNYGDAMEAIAKFAVNICEAIRDAEVYKEIQDSFEDLSLYTLDSRSDEKSEIPPLSSNVRTYSFYSELYLEYVDCMIRKKTFHGYEIAESIMSNPSMS